MPWLIVMEQEDRKVAYLYASHKVAVENARWLVENGYKYRAPEFFNSVQFKEPDTF